MVENTMKQPNTDVEFDISSTASNPQEVGITNSMVDANQLSMAVKSKYIDADDTNPNNKKVEEQSNDEDDFETLRKKRLVQELNQFLAEGNAIKDRKGLLGQDKGITDVSLRNGHKIQVMKLGEGVEFIGKEKGGFFSRFSDSMPIDDAIATILLADQRNYDGVNLHGDENARTNLWVAAQLKGMTVKSGHPADMQKAYNTLQSVMEQKGISEIEFKTDELKEIEKSIQEQPQTPEQVVAPEAPNLGESIVNDGSKEATQEQKAEQAKREDAARQFDAAQQEMVRDAATVSYTNNSASRSTIIKSQDPVSLSEVKKARREENSSKNLQKSIENSKNLLSNVESKLTESIESNSSNSKNLQGIKDLISKRIETDNPKPLRKFEAAIIEKVVNNAADDKSIKKALDVLVFNEIETPKSDKTPVIDTVGLSDRQARKAEAINSSNAKLGLSISEKTNLLDYKIANDYADEQDIEDKKQLDALNTKISERMTTSTDGPLTIKQAVKIRELTNEGNYETALELASEVKPVTSTVNKTVSNESSAPSQNNETIPSQRSRELSDKIMNPKSENMISRKETAINDTNIFLVQLNQEIESLEKLQKNNVASNQDKENLGTLRELNNVLQDKLAAKKVTITPRLINYISSTFSKGEYDRSLNRAKGLKRSLKSSVIPRQAGERTAKANINEKSPYETRKENFSTDTSNRDDDQIKIKTKTKTKDSPYNQRKNRVDPESSKKNGPSK